MSNTLSDNTISVREFSSDDVNYRHNYDLPMQLRMGKNESGTFEHYVLVKIHGDEIDYSNVEVYTGNRQADADTLDVAIEKMIVARDALRSMTVAA